MPRVSRDEQLARIVDLAAEAFELRYGGAMGELDLRDRLDEVHMAMRGAISPARRANLQGEMIAIERVLRCARYASEDAQ